MGAGFFVYGARLLVRISLSSYSGGMNEPRSKERSATYAGIVAAVCFTLFLVGNSAQGYGGGSVSKGWADAMNYFSFFWIILIPCMVAAGLITYLICLKLNARLVVTAGLLLTAALLSYGAYSHQPGRILQGVGGLEAVPEIGFIEYQRLPTFSDGTSFSWIAKCSEWQALVLFKELGIEPANESDKRYKMGYVNEQEKSNDKLTHNMAVAIYEDVFEAKPPEDQIWYSPDGFTGAYSSDDSLLRIIFVPYYR